MTSAKRIKMVIADDERLIRESLHLLMDWKSAGVEVVGVARDGEEALEMIRQQAPRILLSDISMPKMDGIALIQAIKAEGLDCRVIFLSAYSKFTYAQSAVKYGAFDYILKPIDEFELLETVRRCVSAIHGADQKKEGQETGGGEAGALTSALKALVLRHRPLTSDEESDLAAAGFDRAAGRRCIGALFCVKNREEVLRLPAPPDPKDPVRWRQIPLSDCETLLLWNDMDAAGSLERRFFRFLQNHDERLADIFISDPHPLSEISRIYAECSFTRLYPRLGFETSTHRYGDSAVIRRESYPRVDSHQLSSAIHKKDPQAISALINRIFWRFAQREQIYDIDIVKLRCNERLDGLRDDLFLTDGSAGDTENNILIAAKKLINMQFSISDIYDETHAALLRFCSFLDALDDYSGAKLVAQAVAIIKEQYQNVSLSSVAEKLYVSPTHLSRVFAAEKQETFSHYVQRYRMKVARELLTNPKYKIYNIARMVGYSDVAHFSKAFKQLVGLSPLKFKNLSDHNPATLDE